MEGDKQKGIENLSFEKDSSYLDISETNVLSSEEQFTNADKNCGVILENVNILKFLKDKIIRRPWQLLGILAGSTFHIAAGVMTGLTGIILPSLLNPEPGELQLNENQIYIFSSIVSAGAIAGSVISGPLMVWLGQRVCLLIFLPIGICSWLIIAFVQSFWLLLTSRFTLGLLLGLGTVCSNNFVIEIANKKVKGRAVAMLDFSRQIGYLFVYLVGSTSLTWRNVSLICGVSTCIFPFLLLLFLHDSPRWLATKERTEDAERSLQFFRGKTANINSEIKRIMTQNSKSSKSVWDQIKIITEGYIFKIIILSLYLSFACHFTGNLVTVMYSASIFKSANTELDVYTSTVIMGSSRIAGTLFYIFCADKFRKRLLITVPLLMAGLCMTLLGYFFYLQETGANVSAIFWLPLVSLIAYGCLTCIALPVLMVLRSELIPNSVRPIAGSILFMAFHTGAFAASQSFPYMIKLIGSHWTYWTFAINNLMLVIIVLLFMPETQGKSLEEIEDMLQLGLAPKFFRRKDIKKGSVINVKDIECAL